MYTEQKTKAQIKTREEIIKHEIITREMKENKVGGENMWKYIKMLNGEKRRGRWSKTVKKEGNYKLLEWNIEKKHQFNK